MALQLWRQREQTKHGILEIQTRVTNLSSDKRRWGPCGDNETYAGIDLIQMCLSSTERLCAAHCSLESRGLRVRESLLVNIIIRITVGVE